MANEKEELQKYDEMIRVRLTKQQNKLIKAKSLEQNTTQSEIIRSAINFYINRNASDSVIIHASLQENTRKIRALEDKLELLALIITEQTRFLMSVLPNKKINSKESTEIDFLSFKKSCEKSLKNNHERVLDGMLLDLYEAEGGKGGE